MNDLIKIRGVEVLEGYWLRLSFSDGAVKDVDLSELLATGRVFAPIRDQREIFEQVRVNPETRTIEWSGEVDLDPDVLYGNFEAASGLSLRVPRSATATLVALGGDRRAGQGARTSGRSMRGAGLELWAHRPRRHVGLLARHRRRRDHRHDSCSQTTDDAGQRWPAPVTGVASQLLPPG